MRLLICAALVACTVSMACAPAGVHAAGPPHRPVVKLHPVSCPTGAPPDRLAVSWKIDRGLPSASQPEKGRRTIHAASKIQHLFHVVCGLTLSNNPNTIEISCPAATASATYKVVFSRQGHAVLRLTESVQGCSFTWITGKRGMGTVRGLYLPHGIPLAGPDSS